MFLLSKYLYLIEKVLDTSNSAAQKLKSWVAQRATHGESLGRLYFFWVARDFLLYALKFFCVYTYSKLG